MSFAVLACVAAMGFARGVRAQNLDQLLPNGVPGFDAGLGVTVQNRVRPEYDYPDIRLGNTTVRPQVSEALGYDDNVLAQRHGVGSWSANTQASVYAVSEQAANTIAGSLAVDDTRYFRLPSLNTTNGVATVSANHAVGAQDSIGVSYNFFRAQAAPNDIANGNGGITVPITSYTNRLLANYVLTLGRITLTPALTLASYRFDNATQNGTPIIQSYRNRDVVQGEVAGRYELAPQENVVVVARAAHVHYVSRIAGFQTSDNIGYTLLGGVDFTPSSLWHYRALVGLQIRQYDSPSVKSETSPDVEASVTFSPTGLTTVTGSVSRTIEDAAVADAIGYVNTLARLRVDHELYRNVLLDGRALYERVDYLQSNLAAASVAGLGGGVTYLLNRYARVSASYDVYRGSGGVTGAYVRNLTMLRLELGRFDR